MENDRRVAIIAALILFNGPLSCASVRKPSGPTISICEIWKSRTSNFGKRFHVEATYSENFEYAGFSDARCPGVYIPRINSLSGNVYESVLKFDRRESEKLEDPSVGSVYNMEINALYVKDKRQRGGGGFIVEKIWSSRKQK
jgi:hypothetical protein